jgi:broad specificity phosphatase PhoE
MKPTLVLVRHGQAGHNIAQYDQLSALGVQQSERLAAHWLAHGEHFAATCCGSMQRQQRTLDTIRGCFEQAGRPLPAAEVLDGLNEYRFDALLAALAEVEPGHPALLAVRAEPTDRRRWIPMLRASLLAWTEGRLDAHVPEHYAQFCARVARLAELFRQRAEGGRAILAVSSGGVIATFVQQSLQAPAAAAVDLNLALANTAQATFRLDSSGAWRLLAFNSLPHLSSAPDRSLWTMV